MRPTIIRTAILTTAICFFMATGAAAELTRDTIKTSDGVLTVHPINHATFVMTWGEHVVYVDPVGLSLIHISEPTRLGMLSRMPSSA